MAKLALCLILSLSFQYFMVGMAEPAVATNPNATNFINDSCRATLYPVLCVQCLSSYASTIQQSEQQLAQAALSVSLTRARSTAIFVSDMTKSASGLKPREYQAVKDCIVNMGETVNQLSRSIQEIGHMGRVGGQDFEWHMSNVETWVSAALTNENTCADGFAGGVMDGDVKVAITNRLVNVAQVTSNALALVNRFAARQRAAGTTSMP